MTDDVVYLQTYIDICERVLGRPWRPNVVNSGKRLSFGQGLKELRELNAKLGEKISDGVRKDTLIIRDSLLFPDSRRYARCDRAIDMAGIDPSANYGDYDNYVEVCDNQDCTVCNDDEVVDGWVPSNIC